jgi:hypothetical protein
LFLFPLIKSCSTTTPALQAPQPSITLAHQAPPSTTTSTQQQAPPPKTAPKISEPLTSQEKKTPQPQPPPLKTTLQPSNGTDPSKAKPTPPPKPTPTPPEVVSTTSDTSTAQVKAKAPTPEKSPTQSLPATSTTTTTATVAATKPAVPKTQQQQKPQQQQQEQPTATSVNQAKIESILKVIHEDVLRDVKNNNKNAQKRSAALATSVAAIAANHANINNKPLEPYGPPEKPKERTVTETTTKNKSPPTATVVAAAKPSQRHIHVPASAPTMPTKLLANHPEDTPAPKPATPTPAPAPATSTSLSVTIDNTLQKTTSAAPECVDTPFDAVKKMLDEVLRIRQLISSRSEEQRLIKHIVEMPHTLRLTDSNWSQLYATFGKSLPEFFLVACERGVPAASAVIQAVRGIEHVIEHVIAEESGQLLRAIKTEVEIPQVTAGNSSIGGIKPIKRSASMDEEMAPEPMLVRRPPPNKAVQVIKKENVNSWDLEFVSDSSSEHN